MNNLAPAILKPTTGARPVLIHTGDFQGSSVAPTVNAPFRKCRPAASRPQRVEAE